MALAMNTTSTLDDGVPATTADSSGTSISFLTSFSQPTRGTPTTTSVPETMISASTNSGTSLEPEFFSSSSTSSTQITTIPGSSATPEQTDTVISTTVSSTFSATSISQSITETHSHPKFGNHHRLRPTSISSEISDPYSSRLSGPPVVRPMSTLPQFSSSSITEITPPPFEFPAPTPDPITTSSEKSSSSILIDSSPSQTSSGTISSPTSVFTRLPFKTLRLTRTAGTLSSTSTFTTIIQDPSTIPDPGDGNDTSISIFPETTQLIVSPTSATGTLSLLPSVPPPNPLETLNDPTATLSPSSAASVATTATTAPATLLTSSPQVSGHAESVNLFHVVGGALGAIVFVALVVCFLILRQRKQRERYIKKSKWEDKHRLTESTFPRFAKSMNEIVSGTSINPDESRRRSSSSSSVHSDESQRPITHSRSVSIGSIRRNARGPGSESPSSLSRSFEPETPGAMGDPYYYLMNHSVETINSVTRFSHSELQIARMA